MRNFDAEEKLIHDAFMVDEIDVEGFKARLDFSNFTKTRKMNKLPKMVAAMLIFSVFSVGAYANGLFDQWISTFRTGQQAFIDRVIMLDEPVYALSEGLLVEVLAVEHIEQSIFLYLTLQDVSGDRRFPEFGESDFWGDPLAFEEFLSTNTRIRSNPTMDFWLYIDGELVSNNIGGSMSYLDFDYENQLFHLIYILSVFDEIPNDIDTLTLTVNRISRFSVGVIGSEGTIVHGHWAFEVPASDNNHAYLMLEDIHVIDNLYFDYIRVTPLEVRARWTQENNRIEDNFIMIQLEINGETLLFGGGTSSVNSEGIWEGRRSFMRPIDVENITAIIINDIRIPIE